MKCELPLYDLFCSYFWCYGIFREKETFWFAFQKSVSIVILSINGCSNFSCLIYLLFHRATICHTSSHFPIIFLFKSKRILPNWPTNEAENTFTHKINGGKKVTCCRRLFASPTRSSVDYPEAICVPRSVWYLGGLLETRPTHICVLHTAATLFCAGISKLSLYVSLSYTHSHTYTLFLFFFFLPPPVAVSPLVCGQHINGNIKGYKARQNDTFTSPT